ncbi:MliC family protein [Roseovarius sp. SCSIO 43702]|uniref:MliC family protein n=1 Tax=Roseovarius sp. SCSIO 43702 TaxID=2823043 RepID=UPI001C738C82|nr:MliC family protein [Roseovarius sp. SCSIO 43702]QYX57819.1 MliC family protein [Roseovarius sp. SCSIO 43702]
MRGIHTSATFVAALVATPALAEDMPALGDLLGGEVETTTMRYDCGEGGPIKARYLNGETSSIAIVPIDGEDRLLVNVLSASGARYVAGVYEWWTKAESAMLSDLTEPGAITTCVTKDAGTE